MKRLSLFLKKHWRNTVYSNVWISLGAAGLTLQTLYILDAVVWWIPIFVGFATLFTYNFQRLVKLSERPEYIEAGRNNWLYRNRKELAILTLLSGSFSFFLFFRFHFQSMTLLGVSGIISLLYAVRLGKSEEREGKALRDLPYLKLYLIGLVWGLSTALLPLIEVDLYGPELTWVVVERFCFIIAITIPFDIRDIALDSVRQKTLPQVIGIRSAKMVAFGWLIAALICSGVSHYLGFYHFYDLVGIALSYIVSAQLIYKSSPEQDEMYFTALIDGVILLQVLLVLL